MTVREWLIDISRVMYGLFDRPIYMLVVVTLITSFCGIVMIVGVMRDYDKRKTLWQKIALSLIGFGAIGVMVVIPFGTYHLLAKSVPAYWENQKMIEQPRKISKIHNFLDGENVNEGKCRIILEDGGTSYGASEEDCIELRRAFMNDESISYKTISPGFGLFQSFEEPMEVYNKIVWFGETFDKPLLEVDDEEEALE